LLKSIQKWLHNNFLNKYGFGWLYRFFFTCANTFVHTLYILITPYKRMLDSDWLIAVIFFLQIQALHCWICRIFTSCRCICIRFNFFSWYLQNRVTSFGRIKQIHHVRSWKRQTKGIIYLASVLNNIRCN
jgi:hypothetical protein